MIRTFALVALLCLAAAPAPLPDDQAAMRAHVMFLASDAMKGRDAGSPEYEIAAEYVAAQFSAAGLRPAGDKQDYLQRVPLVEYRAAERGDLIATGAAGPVPLAFGTDYIPLANPAKAATAITAPVVLVGQGIVARQYGRDDYQGADVRGKIVAFYDGAPPTWQSEERAHLANERTKAQVAFEHGAVGYLLIKRTGYESDAGNWERRRVTWTVPSGAPAPAGAVPLAVLSEAGAAKLFGGGAAWIQASRKGQLGQPGKPLVGPTLSVATRTTIVPIASSNVAGLLPGSDPVLAKEVVVLSAHLDHVGICPEVDGDDICNGAQDNAVGIAALIEEAKRFRAAGKAPRRSILFLAVTAEEKGLVGADYYARHPTVPKGDIVANVNLDMPILTYAFEDMTVFGADRSTLGPIVARAAASVGVAMSPDPTPEMGLFTRSDHYRFVQQGVPSVFLWPGQKGPGKAAWDKFFAQNYHKPSDDLNLPIDWAQGVRFVAVNYAIARDIADADTRPVWNKGDYFGMLYKGPMAK